MTNDFGYGIVNIIKENYSWGILRKYKTSRGFCAIHPDDFEKLKEFVKSNRIHFAFTDHQRVFWSVNRISGFISFTGDNFITFQLSPEVILGDL